MVEAISMSATTANHHQADSPAISRRLSRGSMASRAVAEHIMSPTVRASPSAGGWGAGERQQHPPGTGDSGRQLSTGVSERMSMMGTGAGGGKHMASSLKMSLGGASASPKARFDPYDGNNAARTPERMSTGGSLPRSAGGLEAARTRWAPPPPWSASYGQPEQSSSPVAPSAKTARLSTQGRTSMMGTEGPREPVKTLRRMFDDKSEFTNTYEFLHSVELAPVDWKPDVGTHTTIFHKGFNRKRQDPIPESTIQAGITREIRHNDHAEKRSDNLATHTKHHFLTDHDTGKLPGGRKHFADNGQIIIRGPEHCVPRANDMTSRRMQVMVTEGLVRPRQESVRDVFGHMFGYSASDLQ